MSDTVIKVEGLYKKFCSNLRRSMYYGTVDVTRSMFGIPYDTGKLRKGEFWALQDINFELKRGETLGLIGQNGCGKTTLLRLLNGIFPPDRGKITINGRIGALIAVGAGFHPHMTGRENIYLNGTILGMSKQEIKRKFDEIVDFAEIGDFLDAPVATYSSGMTVKLGFSIAIHCIPDILLIDEILSVGDLSFNNKSLRKMAEYRENANAILFISHNLEHIRNLCNKVIVLNKGRIEYYGDTHSGIVYYEELSRIKRKINFDKEFNKNIKGFISSPENEVQITNIGILNAKGEETEKITDEEPLVIFCDFTVNKYIEYLYFSGGIVDEKRRAVIWVISNDNNKFKSENFKKGRYRICIKIKFHHLTPNTYTPNIAIRNGITNETYQRIIPSKSFLVNTINNRISRGYIDTNETWELSNTD